MQPPLRSRIFRKIARNALTAVPALALAIVMMGTAQAQTFKDVYSLDGYRAGAHPYAPPAVLGGHLFGTTTEGGANGNGTVFRVNMATGHGVALHTFTGSPDGASPTCRLLWSAGYFYGTTGAGGLYNYGTVFRIDVHGALTILYNFTGGGDGASPYAGVIEDPAGNLYGTTVGGGSWGFGTVYMLNIQTGQETVLYNFSEASLGTELGANPYGGLVRDSRGNLYGTTYRSDQSTPLGTVYKLDTSGKLTILHAFTGGADGQGAYAGLFLKGGIVYGTTVLGGAFRLGTIFSVNIRTGQYTQLYSFTGGQAYPYGGVIADSSGNLYGTTAGWTGAVYKLDTSGNLSTLHYFSGGDDGGGTWAGLVRDSQGNLYGASTYGGQNSAVYAGGAGTIFEIIP